MKKTCANCKYYCEELLNPANPNQHIHDWCCLWMREIPCFVLADRYNYGNQTYWDDIETGDAVCYLFEPTTNPQHEDAWFDRHREENIRNRIQG